MAVLPSVLVACSGDDDGVSESDLSDQQRILVAQRLCPELDTLARLLTPNADSDPDAERALSYAESQAKDLSCEGVLASTTTTAAATTATIDDAGVASVVLDTTRADCDQLRQIEGVARALFAALEEPLPEDDQFTTFLNTIDSAIAKRGC